ncbi:T6SS phospholipase effector Tle1-like catalytic domain-containing protein [Sporobolomyces salmoneus]|uniref:T6SS phospholipase effector Tle1-like catalytic domain-containing protein n=1 Tax=Sporobolomyces salmoneus TaxID=183962 RepID=UPI0031771605
MRRLIVCCDGTWQSAVFQQDPERLTNISRLCTAISRQDTRTSPPIEQIKLYIPGPGTGEEMIMGVVSGAFGAGLLEKVREAYYWICSNYETGDEIHLYGFSRGAYLARLLSSLICHVGLLDPTTTLPLFPKIYTLLCGKRDLESKWGRRQHDELYTLLESDAIKHRRLEQIQARKGGFLVQVLGLFETVPLFHFHTLSPEHDLLPIHNPFSLSDSDLEPEIAKAFQALAISEDRPSYVPVILRHEGKVEGQELLQCWFPGSHSDVGGGTVDHEIANLSLDWLISHVQSDLSLNLDYIKDLSKHASAPWSSHKPHAGLGESLHHSPRHLPHGTDDTSFQHFHESLLEQSPLDVPSDIRPLLEISNHELFLPLTPFEQECKASWPVQPSVPIPSPLPISNPSPPLDSPRLIEEAPTVFHAIPREGNEKNVKVAHSLAGHSRLRRGFRSVLGFERTVVEGMEELHEKAGGAGILGRDSRGR